MLEAEAHHIEDARTRAIFQKLVESIPDCANGRLLGFEVSEGGKGRGAGRTKRAPSPYNNFLKRCAGSKAKGGDGKDFKTCAIEWPAEKARKK